MKTNAKKAKEEKLEMDTDTITFERTVEEIKKQHKKAYMTTIADEKIIWRPLTRGEYKQVMAIGTKPGEEELTNREVMYLREESVAKAVILYPENADEIVEDLAAVAEIITEECMVKSGFTTKATETEQL